MNQETKQKASSVAAFLFMPQWRMTFSQASNIRPVFMRTIALMFSAAGIIPKNHPAESFGMAGVRRVGLFELLFEAYANLRASKTTTLYQWCVYISVGMMVLTTALIAFLLFLNIAYLFADTAHAQIFNHPLGRTDMASVPKTATGEAFNTYVSAGGGANSDYGIMLLNKLFREGMSGGGGIIQFGLGNLMRVYSTGVMVIAAVMLFWCVLTVVVDTAKTGQLGGGKHNMVWAPIRIIFALGLLVPMGGGYSSGQYAVLKLAEWGSNFGTNGWSMYVNGLKGTRFIGTVDVTISSNIVNNYAKMWVCRVAYNTIYAQGGTLDTEMVMYKSGIDAASEIGNSKVVSTPMSTQKVYMTNDTNANLCGSIEYQLWDTADIQAGLSSSNIKERAIAQYKRDVYRNFSRYFPHLEGSAVNDGILTAPVKKFACAYVAQFISPKGPLTDKGLAEMMVDCDGAPAPACGSGPALSGKEPDASCLMEARNTYRNEVASGMTSATQMLRGAVESEANLKQIAAKGWLGMSLWYKTIENDTNVLRQVAPNPSITSGKPDTATNGKYEAQAIIAKYDSWWKKQGKATVGGEEKMRKAKTGGGGAAGSIQGEAQKRKLQKANEKDIAAEAKKNNVTMLSGKQIGLTAVAAGPLGQLGALGAMGYNATAEQVLKDKNPALAKRIDAREKEIKKLDVKIKEAKAKEDEAENDLLDAANEGGKSLFRYVLDKVADETMVQMSDMQVGGVYPLTTISGVGHGLLESAKTIWGSMTALLIIRGATVEGLLYLATSSSVPGSSVGAGIMGAIKGAFDGLIAGPIIAFVSALGGIMFSAGLVMTYYIPLIPAIKVAYSGMTWMVSIFEAVVMIPIAALAHINTEGDGIAGGKTGIWMIWLNILLRPILTVIGFVGGIIVLSSFVILFGEIANWQGIGVGRGVDGLISLVANQLIFGTVCYTAANASFKLMDSIPSAVTKYIGGSQDQSFDGGDASGQLGQMASLYKPSMAQDFKPDWKKTQDERDKKAASVGPGGGGGGEGGAGGAGGTPPAKK